MLKQLTRNQNYYWYYNSFVAYFLGSTRLIQIKPDTQKVAHVTYCYSQMATLSLNISVIVWNDDAKHSNEPIINYNSKLQRGCSLVSADIYFQNITKQRPISVVLV